MGDARSVRDSDVRELCDTLSDMVWEAREESEKLRTQLAEREWVDVNDRLPDHDSYVLTVGGGWESVQRMHYTRHDGASYWDSKHSTKHWLLSGEPVTCWMPLPAPPECPAGEES